MIHKFKIGDYRLVLDVYSGALHRVDELAWEMLDDYLTLSREAVQQKYQIKYAPEEVQEVWLALDSLKATEQLFTPDPLQGEYHPVNAHLIKALCLHLAHDCNLACKYCFAGQGKFGGDANLMSKEVGKQALDLLLEKSGIRKRVEVDFFGGEPLLNAQVMFDLVEYGEKRAKEMDKIIQFTLTTNTLLLDRPIMDFINAHNMPVVLSLDGRPEIHNRMRPLAGGGDSYDRVVGQIKKLLALRGHFQYYVRGTYTHYNLDFCQDVQQMLTEGFKEISLEPVVADPQEEYALRPEDLPLIEAEYERLAELWLEKRGTEQEFNFFHFNIGGETCLPKRLTGCNAGVEYFAVAPNGDLFPCHQFVGQENFKIGDVWQGVQKEEMREEFLAAHVYSKPECRECWAKFYCSGGCHAAAFARNGNLKQPDSFACSLMRKRIECSLYLQAVQKLNFQ